MKRLCVVLLAVAGCGNLTAGQPCTANLQCCEALWCQPLCNGSQTSACAAPCSDSAPCAGGATCSAAGECLCTGATSVDLGGVDIASSCSLGVLPALITLSTTSGGSGAWVGVQASGIDPVATSNTVTFGGVTTPVLYQAANSDGVSSTLYVRVPAGVAAGYGVVGLATCAGTAAQTLPFSVDALAAPTIAGLSPSTAAAGATVVVTGSGFTGVTTVHLLASADLACTATVVNDGILTFVNPGGTSGSAVQVELDAGDAGLGNAYPQLFTFQ